MMFLSVPAILLSTSFIAVLARRDPKRLRNLASAHARFSPSPLSARVRRLLGVLVPVPGVALMLLGAWWAFLVWLGALCIAGWIASRALAIHTG
ncbi:MAG: hypothetical protein IRZ28_06985 [Steroidobacteraceae bacterium]|nr:hypothetical protein [Steroidobacteraceae bacterium]